MDKKNSKLKFIDLYAGLGGFHQALEQLGHDCVFASESNVIINQLYAQNFPDTPLSGDIFSLLVEKDIPKHQLLCGGFPCQPFSRAGKQLGFKDEKKGNHFFKIIEILKFHEPEYLLLENVETIFKHDGGNTFRVIQDLIKELGYDIDFKILSPHDFNIPHHRRRLFIVGRKIKAGGLKKFKWPEKMNLEETTIKSLTFAKVPDEKLDIPPNAKKVFDIWNEFVKNFPDNDGIPSHPIWAHEWGANYDYENRTPFSTPIEELLRMKGSFGCNITGVRKEEIINKFIPRYSTYNESVFPKWKIIYIRRNREFYNKYKEYLDAFKYNLDGLEFSYQKFEWSCKGESYTLDDKIIQFRQSGLRVSRANWAPALTTVKTQNIYFPWLKRKMSILEAAQLQSMQGLKNLPDHRNGAYKAFGNAVNVEVVKRIAKNLIYGK